MATVMEEPPVTGQDRRHFRISSTGWAEFLYPGFLPGPLLERPPRRDLTRRQTTARVTCASWSTASWWRRPWDFRESLLAGALIRPVQRFRQVPRKLGPGHGTRRDDQAASGPGTHSRRGIHLLESNTRWPCSPRADSPDSSRPGHRGVSAKAIQSAEMERKRAGVFRGRRSMSSGRLIPRSERWRFINRGQDRPEVYDQKSDYRVRFDSHGIPTGARRSLRRAGPNGREAEECMNVVRRLGN